MNTQVADGISSPRTSSSATDLTGHITPQQALALFAAGVLVVVLHDTFRWPLKMPGHHGLEWMAILIFSRCASPFRWAGTLTAAGAAVASTMPVIGSHEALTWLFYLLPGIVVDLASLLPPTWRRAIVVLAVAAAIAHATKPVTRWGLAEIFGMEFGSFRKGIAYPILSHLMFGFVGGLAGALAWRGTQRIRDARR